MTKLFTRPDKDKDKCDCDSGRWPYGCQYCQSLDSGPKYSATKTEFRPTLTQDDLIKFVKAVYQIGLDI